MREKTLIRALLIFFLIVASSPLANAAPKKRIDLLLYFFDMNEAAFAYHRHCLSTKKNLNEIFTAKEHYQEFSNYKKSEIRKFIDERTQEPE